LIRLEAVRRVYDLTGGQPFLVQLFGDSLVQRFNRYLHQEIPSPFYLLYCRYGRCRRRFTILSARRCLLSRYLSTGKGSPCWTTRLLARSRLSC
jgi:hypothetical protein